MAQIEEDILTEFFADLIQSDEVSDHIVEELQKVFAEGKTPKAPELVKAFSSPKREEGLS